MFTTINFGADCGTFYSSRAQADAIADAMGADDDDWTYEVVAAGNYYKVAIADEDGEHVTFFSAGPRS